MIKKSFWRAGIAVLVLLTATLEIESIPPLWWDEGWNLTVARTWVERGHYGILDAGQPAPPHLAAAFPTIASVALSFKLFGVGVWQGRLPIILHAWATLALLYYVARRSFDSQIAKGAVIITLFVAPLEAVHPIYTGRQVLAEMPMLFFLLGGYACMERALRASWWFLPLAMLLWAVAIVAKAQTLPFWTVSMSVPLLAALVKGRWREGTMLAFASIGAYALAQNLNPLWIFFLHGRTLSAAPVQGLYDITAFVPSGYVRSLALTVTLTCAVPLLLGLGYGLWCEVKRFRQIEPDGARALTRLALLALSGSWFGWYLFLSSGWLRYLFPAYFVGTIFTAALLRDLTDGFSWRLTLDRMALAVRHRALDRRSIGAILAVIMISLMLPPSLQAYPRALSRSSDAAKQVATFFNMQTPTDSLIETYESELFFLLDRAYYYPPDQVHVDLIRRSYLREDIPIDYDPLSADPDYLVAGRQNIIWQLYDPVLATDEFRLIHRFGTYDVYERRR